jgi:hypothetical protein
MILTDRKVIMPRSRKHHRIQRNWSAQSGRHEKRRRAIRRLGAEPLEKRILLATVTSVDPAANSFSAPVSTDISATFDEAINAGTATTDNFVVHGTIRPVATTVSAAGMTVTADPSANFFPGELVQVTATAGIQGTTTAVPHVWQFRTDVSAGSGEIVDSGQNLGNTLNSQSGALGDMDGDGDLDLFIGSFGNNALFLNDGTGLFTDSGQDLGGGNSTDAATGDLDNDGDLDLVVVNNNQANVVLLNNGSGVLTQAGGLGSANSGDSVELGDLDGDGDMDAFVGNRGPGNRVYLNNGSGSFADTGQSLGNHQTSEVEIGDLDGDGDLDAFIANVYQGNRVWLNNGSGEFNDTGQSMGFNRAFGLAIGDMDGDGDLDAVEANIDGGFGSRVFLNDGSGVFSDSGQAPGGMRNSFSVAIGDIDADGDLDYIVGSQNTNTVYLNDGSGIITAGHQQGFGCGGQPGCFDAGDTRRTPLGDVDGDGDLDIVSINGQGGTGSHVWINQNLNPSVTLSIDNATIAEAGGDATVTATLSATHTQEVTVELAISGTATANDDYTASATQIVIPIGSTTGSVTITAVDDSVDEPDETVIADITSITNGQGSGQVTTTILDDDEPIPVPDVTLALDNVAIPEAAGVATFTATLSVATTVPVTVDFAISGTAAATDFAASGTQVVIAPGATTGSITVTATDDTVDEPDETVVVDIMGVTNGTEPGVQQQTTTITDDDEPVMPDVTLTLDNEAIPEAAGVATFTVTLSEITTVPVAVSLGFTGTASATDYTASGTQIEIAPGATTGSITVTAVDDTEDESNETVVVDIASVSGGNEAGEQQQTTTITDDDDPPRLTVTALTPTESGFVAEFSTDLNTDVLNLYDTQTGGLGPADVTLQGAASGPVAGSLVIDPSLRGVTFIKSGDPLAPDTYTVTLRSAADGFVDAGDQLLDGNDDGNGGDNYSGNFEVAAPAANSVTISIPDIVRGPGQDVNIPADETNGIPVTISEGTNVRAVDMRVAYDPDLLTITGATVGPDAPAGASVIANTTTPGLAILVFFSTSPLPAGEGNFINLQATVPTTDPSGVYGEQQVLDVRDVIVSDGNDNEAPVLVDDAFHQASFFSDVSGNGRVNAADASGVARYAALIDGGFAGSPNGDPLVVGDISGNGRLNAADASLLAQFAALIVVPQIPPIPGGIVITGNPTPGPQVPFAVPGHLGTPIVVGAPPTGLSDPGTADRDLPHFPVVRDYYSEEIEAAIIDDLAEDRVLTQLAGAMAEESGEDDLLPIRKPSGSPISSGILGTASLSLALEEAIDELFN